MLYDLVEYPESGLVYSASIQNKLDQVKMEIGLLVQLYVSHPVPFIAEVVAKQIGKILVDLNFILDIEQRCLCQWLEMN